jgi:alkylhydroperoxidase family enzyme
MVAPEQQLAPPGGWRQHTRPRIPPLRASELPLPLRAMLNVAGKWAEKRTGTAIVPDVFLLLLRHPRLFWPWLRFASRLMPYGTLERRDAELVILRVAWNCRCRYEWGQHVAIGLLAGLSADDIKRIALGSEAPGWSPLQSALLAATDDSYREREISEQSWQRLGAHYRTPQLLELSMLIGHYEMLAGVLNSSGLPLEAHTELQLAQTPIHPQGD